jgi:hypothetical protein
MTTNSRFLINEDLWRTAKRLVSRGKGLRAAIAYFGQNGASLLPFREGDTLVVDLSIPSVRAGQSDPREIEKLLDRGVEIFTRSNLHAKIIATDRETLVGSANASARAQKVLDEAAILTSDPAAVRRARDFVASLCNEPVRYEYLALCKREYRPPRFPNNSGQRPRGAGRRARPAKLWIIGLHEGKIPESEKKRLAQGEQRAKVMIRRRQRSEPSHFWWSTKPAFAAVLRPGDWIICATRDVNGRIDVSPPGQFLFLDTYPRGHGRHRYVFHLEVPRQGQAVTWAQFRRAARKVALLRLTNRPRTRSVFDLASADALLRLWTARGRPSKMLRGR